MKEPLLVLLMLLVVSLVPSRVLGDECAVNGKLLSPFVGLPCKVDPSCVIVGGTHMLEWQSPEPAKIVVVCIHGLGLCARAYKPLAHEFSASGIDGFGVNVRGFGPDRDKAELAKLNCEETVSDVRKLLVSIHEEQPDYKIVLIGESMGGALAVRVAAENPELVDGVVCSAPAWKLLRIRQTAVKGVFQLFLYSGSRPGFASRSLMHQATADPKLTEHWLKDPSHKLTLSLGEARAFLSFIHKTDLYAKKLNLPVLITQGLNDNLVSPKSVARLFKDIPSRNKTVLIDGKGEHLLLEEGEFSPALKSRLIEWIKVDRVAQVMTPAVEIINGEMLSPGERQRLAVLFSISSSNVRQRQ